MRPHVITFTNLFPSQVMPQHGLFVRERMRRVAMAGGFQWTVVAPVPDVIWPLRRGAYRRWADAPATELLDGVTVHHPRFRHWPGMSQRRQAAAVREGARSLLRELCEAGPAVIDAHYLWPDGVAAGELARELGASTHFNPFVSFGEQRNWAIDNIPLKYEWVFHLDADERFTPELVETIKELVESDPDEA